jgi:hypothetical protein
MNEHWSTVCALCDHAVSVAGACSALGVVAVRDWVLDVTSGRGGREEDSDEIHLRVMRVYMGRPKMFNGQVDSRMTLGSVFE